MDINDKTIHYICQYLTSLIVDSENLTRVHSIKAVNQMANQFGERIRRLRKKQALFLRQVAPSLNMDTAQLSKIEKGIRQIKKEQIAILAEVLDTNKDELFTLWLADQVANLIEGEPLADEVLRTVSKNRKNN